MAKIKINKLPGGFKLVNGKIVEDKFMREGGDLRTGDQADYGLVSTPENYYKNTNFNDTNDASVRYSLSSVPRDNANIEAEGGETVLTDLTNDGTFGLYNITGPRHSKGGVPMFLPEQSFIYSDTDKMKFTKDELEEFGISTKNKMTPAELSKKYQLNNHYANLQSPYADKIQATTAELMLKKNMMNLSKIAFGQESKKKFEDGVPLAAHPYLVQQGIDPIEFTAKMEKITKQQAQMKAIAALPPEQQEKLIMLQQMMAQMEEQQPQQEQSFENPSMQDPNMQGQQLAMTDPNQGMARYGREIAKYQEGAETPVNPLPKNHPQYAEAQKLIDSGKYKVIKGSVVDGKQTYNFKKIESEDPKFKAEKEAQLAKEKISGQNQMGAGAVSIYGEDIAGQEKAIQESPKGIYQFGRLSQGTRPELQGKAGEAYGSADIKTPESKADFMDRWGDVVATIPGFDYDKAPDDPQWAKFQTIAEDVRRKEHIAAFGNDKNYVPYWKEKGSKGYVKGEGFDSKLGLHTYNAPRFKLNPTEPGDATFSVDLEQEPKKPIDIPLVENYTLPDPEFWLQDQNNLIALGQVDDNLYLPWAPNAQRVAVAPTFDDWRAQVNANNASANTMAQALGAVGGPQAVANSNILGQTMAANAQAINRVNSNNVNIANQAGSMQAQYDMAIDGENARRQTGVYDNTQKVLQAADNFRNWRVGQNAALQNAALTNRANTYNLNSTFDNFAIDPTTGGPIGFTNARALQKTGQPQDAEALKQSYYKDISDLSRELGRSPTEAEIKSFYTYTKPQAFNSDMTRGQQELAEKQASLGYITGAKGKEIKRMVVPFYTGKMGG
jgi:hypothetical protein